MRCFIVSLVKVHVMNVAAATRNLTLPVAMSSLDRRVAHLLDGSGLTAVQREEQFAGQSGRQLPTRREFAQAAHRNSRNRW